MPKDERTKIMIKPWTKLSSTKLANYRIFSIRSDVKISPRTGAQHDFFVIDSVDWVNVAAVTPDNQLVMVEQFRHGSETVELEIPGGVMDPADKSPLDTGCRELMEETGYAGENPQIVGKILPNPAIMHNTCYTVFVENCKCAGSVKFDPSEDVETRLVPLDEVEDLVASGKIRHSLVVVALYHFYLWRKRHGRA